MILKTILTFFFIGILQTQAYNTSIDYPQGTLTNYEYKNKTYKIFVPYNIIKLENDYMHGSCIKYCKLIQTNILLIKLNLPPIY